LELFELLDAHAWTPDFPGSDEWLKSLAGKDLYDTKGDGTSRAIRERTVVAKSPSPVLELHLSRFLFGG
jgi:hypothetical protein